MTAGGGPFSSGDFGDLLNEVGKLAGAGDMQGCLAGDDATISGCIGEAVGHVAVGLVTKAGVSKALEKFKGAIGGAETAINDAAKVEREAQLAEQAAQDAERAAQDALDRCLVGGLHSFSGDTLVLMADGSARRIDQIGRASWRERV